MSRSRVTVICKYDISMWWDLFRRFSFCTTLRGAYTKTASVGVVKSASKTVVIASVMRVSPAKRWQGFFLDILGIYCEKKFGICGPSIVIENWNTFLYRDSGSKIWRLLHILVWKLGTERIRNSNIEVWKLWIGLLMISQQSVIAGTGGFRK